VPAGRWSPFRPQTSDGAERSPAAIDDALVEFTAHQLLARYGVVFRRLVERERIPVPWRDLVRAYRRFELRGDVRGGRFVHLFAGEQYALPEAVELMRRLRRMQDSPRRQALDRLARAEHEGTSLEVAATDPLNLQGVLTPDARVPALAGKRVRVA
jgi:ATP-dependent Lhr-like helicase